MKNLLIMLMLALTVAPVAGCVVEPAYRPRPVYAPRPACVLVPAHYNAVGRYIPAHCR
jgi:hypothetical protein